jgi:serine O-acetyltransferase
MSAFSSLTRVAREVRRDVEAARERDPSALGVGPVEMLATWPGIQALLAHRVAHALHRAGLPLLPRAIAYTARALTGIEIHHAAQVGQGLFIDHGSGVVIGETTEIGDNVTLYQGVTLGGTGKEHGKRHPTLGDNVVVGSGANVLGSVKIGDNVKIGSGTVVVHDVPSNATVVGNPGHPVLVDGQRVGIPDIDYTHLPDPMAEAIKCLVDRIIALEQELDEINPERKDRRRARIARNQQVLEELLHYAEGAGI